MTDASAINGMGSLTQSVVNTLIRFVLKYGAGFLLAHGLIAETQSAQFTEVGSSVLIGAAALAWSIYQKKVAHKAVEVALNTPAPGK